jgi:hypothetical protein
VQLARGQLEAAPARRALEIDQAGKAAQRLHAV